MGLFRLEIMILSFVLMSVSCIQSSGRRASVFSALRLDLPDASGLLIGSLSSQQQPFHLYHDGIGMEEKVEVFRSLVG